MQQEECSQTTALLEHLAIIYHRRDDIRSRKGAAGKGMSEALGTQWGKQCGPQPNLKGSSRPCPVA